MKAIKYYRLMRYEDNPIGAVFEICTSEELEEAKKLFLPDFTDEISVEEYEEETERNNRRFMRLATGYPK